MVGSCQSVSTKFFTLENYNKRCPTLETTNEPCFATLTIVYPWYLYSKTVVIQNIDGYYTFTIIKPWLIFLRNLYLCILFSLFCFYNCTALMVWCVVLFINNNNNNKRNQKKDSRYALHKFWSESKKIANHHFRSGLQSTEHDLFNLWKDLRTRSKVPI